MYQEADRLRVKLSESESRVLELLAISDALEMKLSAQRDRRALHAHQHSDIITAPASAADADKQPVSSHCLQGRI